MIIEILQLGDLLINHKIHLLILFFIFFLVIPVVWLKTKSRTYKPYSGHTKPVTVIVPAHKEDYKIFNDCLESIQKQHPAKLIVAIDSNDEKMHEIAEKNNAYIISFKERVGKRRAIATAWEKVETDIVVHVDSDTILNKDCLTEITKPFNDPKVFGVAVKHDTFSTGSRLSYMFAKLIKANYTINSRALNNGLVVVDGSCNAWRRDFLLNQKEAFINEQWMGNICQIGEDRFLSREALKAGGKTVFQETAKITSAAQSTFKNFLKQQLRWRRSGTKFFVKDVKENMFPSTLYGYKCLTYYSAPFLLLIAIITDLIFFPFSNIFIPWYLIPVTIIIGSTLIGLFRQLIYFGKPITGWSIILQSLIGLFVMLPISIYGIITISKQNIWGTRGYKEDGKRSIASSATLIALSVIIIVPAMLAALTYGAPDTTLEYI
ncbi:MAG: glycosyltransferase [Nitrososphaerota archaeon]|jgi:cellulose synthase/poly-beta-1,6-N-acetylglucosamine synthase-like glycosyltransferase|nr:glycosyltransferase [Nitrososphaerota archaeon]